ncbi:MAG: hypothetical protein B6D58_02930 [candidate division Zixibacteria bacterium 4484_95]|nr:MAG: hypothetical protein B6D58_02930 [candidate division Zixibacteria bacterium 4484_95]RKX20477.1 MAG: hypothetical protein DRP26_01625 [candidate division Zixibacteria bacterium]
MRILILAALGVILLVGSAFADVDDFDNEPYSVGVYIQGYPGFSTASNYYDQNGDKQEFSDTWNGFGFMLRPTYYSMFNDHRWSVSVVMPFMSYSQGSGNSESGFGDIQISAAYWIIDDYNKGNYLSMWFWSDLPTGDDNKGLGTGQVNIRPGFAYTWYKNPYHIQTSIYYNLRLENSDTNLKPGDEIWFNCAFGYWFNKDYRASLEFESGFGQDWKWDSNSLPDTKEQWYKLGPSFCYQINPDVGLKFKMLYNLGGTNTLQTIDIGARVTYGL